MKRMLVQCLCCGREFRMASDAGSELAQHVDRYHHTSGYDIQQLIAWMIEDGVFQVVEKRAA